MRCALHHRRIHRPYRIGLFLFCLLLSISLFENKPFLAITSAPSIPPPSCSIPASKVRSPHTIGLRRGAALWPPRRPFSRSGAPPIGGMR
ncbi:hypothetical protein GW17_00019476 [Ensete ventricosum]|nr:hypothetical protein GW17_00019476 [Ensete ventricosum]RZS09004.1 hypothetical protein BHM03_00040055 [Ensete ventricosum]